MFKASNPSHSHRASDLSAGEVAICAAIAARHDALLADLSTFVASRTGPGPRQGENIAALRQTIGHRLEAIGAKLELDPGRHKPAWLAMPGEAGAGKETVAGVSPNSHPHTSDRPTGIYRRLLPPTPAAAHPAILIAGHLDTVHPDGSGFDTLAMAADGKTATGPGIVDMKGGLVIALHALEVLQAAGVPIS